MEVGINRPPKFTEQVQHQYRMVLRWEQDMYSSKLVSDL